MIGKKLFRTKFIPQVNIKAISKTRTKKVFEFDSTMENFINYCEDDKEKLKRNEASIFNKDSYIRLQKFVKSYLEIYRSIDPEIQRMFDNARSMKQFNN